METVGVSTPVKTQLRALSVAATPSTSCTRMGGAALVSVTDPTLADSGSASPSPVQTFTLPLGGVLCISSYEIWAAPHVAVGGL